MTQEIPWLIFQTAPEAKLASRRNALIVMAATPEQARERADASNTFGETYTKAGGFHVVAFDAAMQDLKGELVVVGDLASVPQFDPNASPFVF